MDGAINLTEANTQYESSKSNYRDIYQNEPVLLERDHSLKTRLKQNEEKPESFSMSEFPALSNSPNGLYSEKLGSFLSFNYQGRPTIGKVSSFKMEKEDFPALPQSHLPEVSSDISRSVLEIANSDPSKNSKKNFTENYGILNLISKIREERTKNSSNFLNRNFLDFGTDISLLNLDINSKNLLSQQIISPFYSKKNHLKITKNDPTFYLPKCYIEVKPITPNLNVEHLSTQGLFYTYYYFPKDIKQLLAAYELYNRGWKYHKEGKIWFIMKPDTQIFIFDKKNMKQVFYHGNLTISPDEFKNSDQFLSREELSNLLRSQVKT